eukprot:364415-Chlamydomonas_euryale.AAC.2
MPHLKAAALMRPAPETAQRWRSRLLLRPCNQHWLAYFTNSAYSHSFESLIPYAVELTRLPSVTFPGGTCTSVPPTSLTLEPRLPSTETYSGCGGTNAAGAVVQIVDWSTASAAAALSVAGGGRAADTPGGSYFSARQQCRATCGTGRPCSGGRAAAACKPAPAAAEPLRTARCSVPMLLPGVNATWHGTAARH